MAERRSRDRHRRSTDASVLVPYRGRPFPAFRRGRPVILPRIPDRMTHPLYGLRARGGGYMFPRLSKELPYMLSNREFSGLVDRGTYPEQVAVPLDQPFVNANGVI